MSHTFTPSSEHFGKRVDRVVAELPDVTSRALAQRMVKEGSLLVNAQRVEADYKLKPGDVISFELPPPQSLNAAPEEGELKIVFEDEDVVVVNKPAGLVVHPAPGNPTGTLVNFLMHHFDKLSGSAGSHRPGLVHRIDKGTSGLLVVAKNDFAHESLAQQFHSGSRWC